MGMNINEESRNGITNIAILKTLEAIANKLYE